MKNIILGILGCMIAVYTIVSCLSIYSCDGTGIDCAGVGNQRGCGKGNSKEPRTV